MNLLSNKLIFVSLISLFSSYSGSIYTDDMLRILPYKNTVDMMTLQGEYIIEALEHAVSNYNPDRLHGRFLQVSGNYQT